MTETEQHTFVLIIKYDRPMDEDLDWATERLDRVLSRVSGVVGTTCVDARPLDQLRAEMRAVLSDGFYRAEQALDTVLDTLDRALPDLVDEGFKRGVASMLFPLNQEQAFARGEVAECLRLAAQAVFMHRGVVRQDQRLQEMAAQFAGLLDVLTDVPRPSSVETASQHMEAINRLPITGEVPPTTGGLAKVEEAHL